MPFYTYRCNTCGHLELDVLRSIDSLHERVDCPTCLTPVVSKAVEGEDLKLGDKRIKMERLISTPVVINRGNEGTARAGRGRGSK